MLLESWAFSREAIGNGELWRLLGANFAHLSWTHLYGNLAVFAGAVALLRGVADTVEVLLVLVLSSLATTLGLYFGSSLHWYVGASGALYGLMAWGAVRLPMPGGLWLLSLLMINVAIDQGRSLSWLSEPLAPQSHYWGLAGGLTLALVSGWKDGLVSGWKDGLVSGWKDSLVSGWRDGTVSPDRETDGVAAFKPLRVAMLIHRPLVACE